jgi:hypothetical protein
LKLLGSTVELLRFSVLPNAPLVLSVRSTAALAMCIDLGTLKAFIFM